MYLFLGVQPPQRQTARDTESSRLSALHLGGLGTLSVLALYGIYGTCFFGRLRRSRRRGGPAGWPRGRSPTVRDFRSRVRRSPPHVVPLSTYQYLRRTLNCSVGGTAAAKAIRSNTDAPGWGSDVCEGAQLSTLAEKNDGDSAEIVVGGTSTI